MLVEWEQNTQRLSKLNNIYCSIKNQGGCILFVWRYESIWTKLQYPCSTDPRPAEIATSIENQRLVKFNKTLRSYFKEIQESY